MLDSVFSEIDAGGLWVTRDELLDTVRKIKVDFDRDYALVCERLEYIFCEDCAVEDLTHATVLLIDDWHRNKAVFCTMAMVVFALERFGFLAAMSEHAQVQALIKGMLVASVLAEIPCYLPYHNNLHFKKVLLHVMRMVFAHNSYIFKDTSRQLSLNDIAKLIIGACIHDIGHEGRGNFVDRQYHLARIEKRSFDYALPFLQASGLDKSFLDDVRTMLITTDVSPVGDPISPVNQLRTAYEYHYGMDEMSQDYDDTISVSEELRCLKEDSHLCFLCVMLQEADIMNSAGVDYEITRFESIAISREMGLSHSLPEDTLLFLVTICRGKLLSDAARYLAEDKLEEIVQHVMQDLRKGNKSYL